MPEVTEKENEVASKSAVSRRQLMSMAGGTVALGAVLAACGSDDSDSGTTGTATDNSGTTESNPANADTSTDMFGKGDLGILNYALTLEYLETAFYQAVIKSKLFKGSDLEAIKKFGSQEADHVVALTDTVKKLGGKPAPMPKTEFPLMNAPQVLKLASTVENLGAAAYLGQAPRIQSPEVLAAALSIHSVEARHAAALNTLLGKTIVPDGPFAKPAEAGMVLNAVQPFIVS